MRALHAIAVTVVVAAPALPGWADATGYEAVFDWNSTALVNTGDTAGMFSSYDPSGNTGNDFNHYLGFDSTTGLYIMASLNGPGELTRIWMPHLTADQAAPLRVIVDGTTVMNTDTSTFLPKSSTNSTDPSSTPKFGNGPMFRTPLVQTRLGGSVSYEPIPFQKSCMVESYPANGSSGIAEFYQVNYRKLPAGTTIPSYTGTLNSAQSTQRSAAVNILTHIGSNPGGAEPAAILVSQPTTSIPANGALSLANPTGSGQVRALHLQFSANGGVTTPTDAQLDGLRLRIRYDGDPNNAVDVPVSQFFGVGHGRAAYQSVPMGVGGDGSYYSYWPMPFRNGASLELYNNTAAPISLVSSQVEYLAGAQPASAGYFHAFNSQETISSQPYHTLLHVSGAGRYVGNILSVAGTYSHVLEGNDIITVDGNQTSTGTGVEDAYNGGYYYNNLTGYQVSDNGDVAPPVPGGLGAYSGLLSIAPNNNAADQYRWLIADSVPFSSGIDVKIENVSTGESNSFGSTAFYYTAAPEPASIALFALSGPWLLRRPRRTTIVGACR